MSIIAFSLFSLLLAFNTSSGAAAKESQPPRKKNVILVVMDTTRADAISAYRSDGHVITPNIDRLAKQGLIFENAFSNAAFTTPSTMTIFTGLFPTTHQVNSGDDPRQILSSERKTITEILKANGYRTFWTGDSSYHNVLGPLLGFSRGFDHFKKIEVASKADVSFPALFPGKEDPANRIILDWINEKTDTPFFLFLHTWRPHSPYVSHPPENQAFLPKSYSGKIIANGYDFQKHIFTSDFDLMGFSPQSPNYPKTGPFANAFWSSIMFHDVYSRAYWSLVRTDSGIAEDTKFLRSAYEAAVNVFDRRLGELLDQLTNMGIMKDTLVIITADHGEEFLEHGNFFHQTNFNENLRIPLILFAEGLPAKRIAKTAQSADIVPTTLDILSIKTTNYFDGTSLKESWEKQNSAEDQTEVFSHSETIGLSSLQNRSYKITYNLNSKKTDIFDLKKDPGEKTPLKKISQDAPMIEGMKRRLSARIGRIVE